MLSSSHVYSLDVTVPTSITVHWSWCCHCSCTGITSQRHGIKGKESVNNEGDSILKEIFAIMVESRSRSISVTERVIIYLLIDTLWTIVCWHNVNAYKNWTPGILLYDESNYPVMYQCSHHPVTRHHVNDPCCIICIFIRRNEGTLNPGTHCWDKDGVI